jgi:hypothetical protein
LKNSRYSRLLECANLVQFGLESAGNRLAQKFGADKMSGAASAKARRSTVTTMNQASWR